jgi:hypothetical protein
MGSVIIPKTYVKEIHVPLIFLAGPIRSAPNWQDAAIEAILLRNADLVIASPRREVGENIKQHLLRGDENVFPRQRAWERYYLDLASRSGAIMFWLPGESTHNCQKAYGAMTRVELGQWMTNYRHDKSIRFCLGTDGRFSEFGPIKYDLSLDAPDKRIFGSLDDTCSEAIRLSLRK